MDEGTRALARLVVFTAGAAAVATSSSAPRGVQRLSGDPHGADERARREGTQGVPGEDGEEPGVWVEARRLGQGGEIDVHGGEPAEDATVAHAAGLADNVPLGAGRLSRWIAEGLPEGVKLRRACSRTSRNPRPGDVQVAVEE